MVKVSLPVLVLLACGGCTSNACPPKDAAAAKAYANAITTVCDVDRLAGLAPDEDPLGVGRKRSAWLAAHVENPDVIEVATLMSVKGAGEQATMLRQEARSIGVSRCALADSLESAGMGGLSP